MAPILHTIDYLTIAAIVLLGVIISAKYRPSSPGTDQARVDRLETKVDQLVAMVNNLQSQANDSGSGSIAHVIRSSSSVPIGTLSPSVRTLVDQGQKIQAIKLLREETGLDLKEAKDAVDNYKLRSR